MPEQAPRTISTSSTADAQAVLSTAEHLLVSLRLRKEQVAVLLSCCQKLVDKATEQNGQYNLKAGESSSTSSMVDLKSVCEAMQRHLDALTQKGFLWCIVNAEKIDDRLQITQDQMLGLYQTFELDGAEFLSILQLAQKKDIDDMAQHLLYLSQDDDRLLQAIQDRDGVYRRTEELEVNIIKHVQNIPISGDSRPEDLFLQAAEKMLRRRPDRKSDLKFPNYILSTLDVEHYVHQMIGSGASGQVYLGSWKGTRVAIKRMHPSEAKTISTDMRRKIYHEISIWAKLQHDNILPLYGACPDADVPFLVMKYCPDGDVRHFLQENPTADRLRLSCEIAVGLAFLHSKSIVHADIKGMNVLISGEHRPLLTDFGLSIVMNEIRNLSTYSTDMQSKPRGTMAWMAPEVHRGSRPDKASDVYSLGMTIWEIYSDQTPFSGTRLEALSGVITSGSRPERPNRLYDGKVWAVVRRCWLNDVGSRPTANQVVNLLDLSNGGGVSNININEIDHDLLAPASPVTESQNWTSWNSSLTMDDSRTDTLPWQAEKSTDGMDGSIPSTTESALDHKDKAWMQIIKNLPPQWEHVPWGGSMYVNSLTIPFVPTDVQYTYRVVKDQKDLGIRKTYERNADGSQTINFLEYNQGYGIIDSTHIKVFATDPGSGGEFLAVEWNPRNKSLGNVESQYAKEVRAGGFSWTVTPDTHSAGFSSQIVSVTLNNVPANTNHSFRIFSGDIDLGARYVGEADKTRTLTINLREYNNGEGISSQSPIKVLVLDRDIDGRGTLVATRWPSDTSRDIPLPPHPHPSPTTNDEVIIPDAASSQLVSLAPSSHSAPLSVHSLSRDTRRFLCFTFRRSPPSDSKNTSLWKRFRSLF